MVVQLLRWWLWVLDLLFYLRFVLLEPLRVQTTDVIPTVFKHLVKLLKPHLNLDGPLLQR